MLLSDVVRASTAIAATRSRTQKAALVADLLAAASPSELPILVTWLGGSLRQRRTGIGWRAVADLPAPASTAQLMVEHVDHLFEQAAELSGPGSVLSRNQLVSDLMTAATGAEQEWLRSLITGNLRQGALDAAVQSAVASLTGVSLARVRRAAMLAGATEPVAVAALGADDPESVLASFQLQAGRPVLPMLASSAPEVAQAWEAIGADSVVVDTKLDGIRLQVHRTNGTVLAVTRSLDDITERLPEVVRLVETLPGGDLVLDGEAMLLTEQGTPAAFQDTAARTGSAHETQGVHPFFFDLLHSNGEDLLDAPLVERLNRLDALVPEEFRTPRLLATSAREAELFARAAVADGHEGVVVKATDASYQAGRRGAAWIKVKPVHTLDLVVLAVEHGSGRRAGWLSNIHLGARDPNTGEFVMVGKTFKGMSDEVLAWQTAQFRDLAVSDDGWVVTVRPNLVVEIAIDGVQRSSRYPGGVALRFARVVRYRDDKTSAEADTIEKVRSHLTAGASPEPGPVP